MELKIKENSWIARVAAWKLHADKVAIVIGQTIHLHQTSAKEFMSDRSWVQHELCHLRQFKEYGTFSFIVKYLLESLKHGYYNNKFEVEARRAERELP